MDLFRALIVDDDSQSNNGYDHTQVTARPLPAGEYSVFYNWQHYYQIPCNHVPTDAYNDWTVTVTAPEGAVHEAFFDPADLTPGAGFSASSGVLEPAGFSIGGTAASITGLKWQSGSVVLTLAPYASLSGHAGLHRPGRVRGPVPRRLVGHRGQRRRHADVGGRVRAVAGRRPADAAHSPGALI